MGKKTLLLLLGILSVVVFLESSIPYMYAERKCLSGNTFLGQVIFTPDQNMYFSFIRQAADGHFVLANKLTYIPNQPVFVNLEFWLVGFIQRITGISENAVYHVWRCLGLVLLVAGFSMLAKLAYASAKQRIGATAAFLLSGGFGFVSAFLLSRHFIGVDAAMAGMFDIRYGYLPFMQVVTNPHFSFPHGLILLAYACYLRGEAGGRTRNYVLSGVLFLIIGLVRPYDIMPPFIIFPLYTLFIARTRFTDLRTMALRLLPLLCILPVLGYNLWLFRYNELFKYWSQQGHNAGSLPSVPMHLLAFGVLGILAVVRLWQARVRPLTSFQRFMVLWFVATFVLIRLGQYLPLIGWSPQVGVYLAVPLTLLGFDVALPSPATHRMLRCVCVAAVVAVIIAGNTSIVLYYSKNFNDATRTAVFYASKQEAEAWKWLGQHTTMNDVVLATPGTSQRIAKYTSARVAAAHYSVTPKFDETATMVNLLMQGAGTDSSRKQMMSLLHPSYIYVGPAERAVGAGAALTAGAAPVYKNDEVEIYRK